LKPETLNLELHLERFSHMAGADAARANLDASDRAVFNGLYLLQVGVPCPAGFVVGMADVVAEAGTLTTDFAYFGHIFIPSEFTEAAIYSR
jgi:hypothetical protein